MNLTEIEKAVVELSFRHPRLTKEFLRTLLEAAGWEEKHIKEAQIIFTAHLARTVSIRKEQEVSSEDLSVSLVHQNDSAKVNDMTFLRSDGTEEGELHIDEPKGEDERESKESAPHTSQEVTAEEKVPATAERVVAEVVKEKNEDSEKEVTAGEAEPLEEREEESLVKSDISLRPEKVAAWSELPDNLPLVPFESAPHVWSLGRYKDTFYGGPKVEEKKVEIPPAAAVYAKEQTEVPVLVSVVTETPKPPVINQPTLVQKEPEVELDFEKTPISKGEESLVVLAGVMLLAIMLILGYMYGNGRL